MSVIDADSSQCEKFRNYFYVRWCDRMHIMHCKAIPCTLLAIFLLSGCQIAKKESDPPYLSYETYSSLPAGSVNPCTADEALVRRRYRTNDSDATLWGCENINDKKFIPCQEPNRFSILQETSSTGFWCMLNFNESPATRKGTVIYGDHSTSDLSQRLYACESAEHSCHLLQ